MEKNNSVIPQIYVSSWFPASQSAFCILTGRKKYAGKMEKNLFLLASPAQFWEHSKTTRQPWPHGCSARGEQGGKKSRKKPGGKRSQKKRQLFSKHFDISNICHSFSLQSLLMFVKVLLEGRVLGWNLRFTSWQMRIFVSNL